MILVGWRYLRYELEEWSNLMSSRPILPLFKSLILRNTTLARELMFYDSTKTHIDELYHENSKYSKNTTDIECIKLHLLKLKQMKSQFGLTPKKEFFKEGKAFMTLDVLPEYLRKILEKIQEEVPIFINVFLLVKSDGCYDLLKFDRASDYLILIKKVSLNKVHEVVENNIFTLKINIEIPQAILFVYGNHVISRIIYGNRGYRVVLIECGKVIGLIENVLRTAGLAFDSTYIFYDDTINEFLEFNDREFAVHAVVVVGGETSDG
ncbi:MAG TPA: hypothetical protein EYH44_05120 [Thermoprotei archaeon]|nr:hypothetical protein [Thermoprotei archaeon]